MNTQFDLNAMLSVQSAVQQIPCDILHPYHNHKFELYTGERLEDMVESIRENGVLSPIIVQPDGDGYEILIGHNRWNASKLAGLPTVPAIVKTGLSEDEMEMYAIESNVIQRSFTDLKISEQAAVIALRHSEMFSQGKRNDIIRELEMLENPDKVTSDPVGMKSADVNDNIGEQYGLGRSSVVRLVRIDKLIPELKALVDDGSLAIRSGVELSFLSEEAQETVADQAEDFKIDMKKAKALREGADSEGDIDTAAIVRIITGTENVKPKPRNVKISDEVYSRFFTADMKKKEVTETIEKALAFYFANMEENDDE
ncbi:MAG: ParB/RepB/Spo0J family partition protein [Ruminococcus sp.]|uniref:ParB/RepB/Spo0J family partition protein n=1 Tax=Ruminococcus sp. TaxID=41978 RepID=UPI0025E165F8|nr:ParB/RepB/Spo0J family partition protein [Ruminococcus sp.]MBR1384157.1 ParB/RepB/Spo0J family partition protein [Ruminococcus sp.]MBR1431766.1 ParB/RepB/Spo0J family partition protein [Ruminococcus sp.]